MTATASAPPRTPRARDIVVADLTKVLQMSEHTDPFRRCVIVEVVPAEKRMVLIFGSGDYHHREKCHCIDPGTADAAPFGQWLRKKTHFSAYNVVDAPLTLPHDVKGSVPHGFPVDPFDKYVEVVTFADLKVPKLVKRHP